MSLLWDWIIGSVVLCQVPSPVWLPTSGVVFPLSPVAPVKQNASAERWVSSQHPLHHDDRMLSSVFLCGHRVWFAKVVLPDRYLPWHLHGMGLPRACLACWWWFLRAQEEWWRQKVPSWGLHVVAWVTLHWQNITSWLGRHLGPPVEGEMFAEW